MAQQGAFLSHAEFEDYQQIGALYVARSVIEVPAFGEVERADSKSKEVIPHLLERFKKLISRGNKWFECWCITVPDRDGMSWSAEKLNATIEEYYPRFKRLCLTDRRTTDELPLISDCLGRKQFLKLAADHKLTTSFLTLRSWTTWVIIIAAVALLFIINVLEHLLKSDQQKLPYFIIVMLAAMSLISKHVVGAYFSSHPQSKAIENFVKELEEQENDPKINYLNFVDVLARRLKSYDFPRVVIIDEYEHLDSTTRRVIESYLNRYAEESRTSEFWVVFERQDSETFSKQASLLPQPFAYKQTRFFRQLIMTDVERHQLGQKMGRPEEVTEFTTLKGVFRQSGEDVEEILNKVRDYRKKAKRSGTYGELDLLYLISLDYSPSKLFLKHERLSSDLSQEHVLRRKVLSQFLYGGKLSKREIRVNLETMEKTFASLLVFSDGEQSRGFRTKPEATRALTENYQELELPPSGLGHLFWGLFWHDKLLNSPAEAFWIRKLAYHLALADESKIDDEAIQREIIPRIFEALIYVADGYLRTCLFHKRQMGSRDLQDLLSRAFDLIETDDLRNSPSHQKRLLRTCWEAYSVLSDDEILRIILNTHELMKKEPVTEGNIDVLERLFFESIPLSQGNRTILSRDLFDWKRTESVLANSIFDYARLRAAWFALSITPLTPYSRVTELGRAVTQVDQSLEGLTHRALERINTAPHGNVSVTDMVALSLALWCHAIKLNPRGDVGQSNPLDAFSTLIDESESAILVAGEMKREATTSQGMNFLMNGLAREIYAVTLASILTAYHHLLFTFGDLPFNIILESNEKTLIGRISDIFEFSADFLDYRLPSISNYEDLRSLELSSKIDELLRFCGIIWNRFNLQHLHDYINLRRIQFNSVCKGIDSDFDVDVQPLLESVGLAINEKNFTGLITNVVIADCVKTTAELEAFYLRQAGLILLYEDFGDQLSHEFSLIVVYKSHSFRTDVSAFLHDLLEETSSQSSFLEQFLNTLPKDMVIAHVLEFVNCMRSMKGQGSAKKLEKTLRSFIDQIEPEEVKLEAESVVELSLMEQKFANDEMPSTTELLLQWKDRKDLWTYPSILSLLLINCSDSRLEKEIISILDRDHQDDSYNSYLNLALALLEKHINADVFDDRNEIPLMYLTNSIERWESKESVESNLRIFYVLYRLSEDRDEKNKYKSDLEKWHLHKLRRDLLQRLPDLLKQGQFFLVFQDHFRSMKDWGLRTDMSASDFMEQININEKEKVARATSWKKSGASVPDPLNGNVVSGDFLYLGFYIFTPPNAQNPNFDDERYEFNKKASEALFDLIDLIAELPELPASIKSLLQNYSHSLSDYINPRI